MVSGSASILGAPDTLCPSLRYASCSNMVYVRHSVDAMAVKRIESPETSELRAVAM